jgi:hypothetical protein
VPRGTPSLSGLRLSVLTAVRSSLMDLCGYCRRVEQVAGQREVGLVLPTGDVYPHKGRLVAGSYEFNPETQTTEVTSQAS